MAKRKITVTVDEDLVDRAHQLGVDSNLSAVVNDALTAHVERLGRLAALADLLESWKRSYGPVGERAQAEASAAFDELDGVAGSPPAPGTAGPGGAARSRA
jgi:hypothetical protein